MDNWYAVEASKCGLIGRYVTNVPFSGESTESVLNLGENEPPSNTRRRQFLSVHMNHH